MLKLIYGPFGSGKTYCLDSLLLDALRNGKEAVLLVPEQEVMEAERRIADRADSEGVLCEKLTVVSFRRLANLAFRKYGGLEYKYLDESGKLLIIWQKLKGYAGALSAYKTAADRSLIELMLSTCNELKRYSVSPAEIAALADTLDESLLKDKLNDIATIYSAFTSELNNDLADAEDDVTRLADILKKEAFLNDRLLFVDSFNGFTASELQALEYAMKQCDVTLTLCLPDDKDQTGFMTLSNTERALKEAAKKHNVPVYDSARLQILEKYIPDEFRLINEKLWDFSYAPKIPENDTEDNSVKVTNNPTDNTDTENHFGKAPTIEDDKRTQMTEESSVKEQTEDKNSPARMQKKDNVGPLRSDRITLATADDVFSEAEFIAIKICELIRSGARYRDIAIVSRNTSVFDGIYDVVFKKFGIPFFYSRRTGITSTALFRTVRSALDIISSGWKARDVLVYAKTGLCGFDDGDADTFESYVLKWDINGKRFTDGYDWNMNPDGYTDRLSDKGKETLIKVNELRVKLCAPLIKLSDSLKGVTIREAAAAIYTFINECGAYENLNNSNDAEAVTVYNTFISLLDTMVSVVGDTFVDASSLSALLTMTGEKVDYGRIPVTVDCVKAGDAASMRLHGIKHVFLTSCESGVFPRSVEDDSVFSDAEKEVLEAGGIHLSPNTAGKNDEEMFFFLRCACSAVSTLTLTHTLLDGKAYPSVGFSRIAAMFPLNKVISYPKDISLLNRIQTAESGKEAALGAYGTPLYDVLKELYESRRDAAFLNGMPISTPKAAVSKEITSSLYKKEFSLSQSRIERYVKCPFSYYCEYVLNLQEKKRSDFASSDKGSYIHRILEKIIAELFSDSEKRSSISEQELKELIEKTVREMLEIIFGIDTEFNARFGALVNRLNKTVLLLVKNILEEFKNSDFTPKFFELNIGKEQQGAVPFKIPLSDGRTISINGIVDRVDTLEKDGDVYIRVVDYKTGSKEHSLKKIQLGLDLQMLLYLFSLSHSDTEQFREAVGVKDGGKLRPAGVLYQPSRVKAKSVDEPIGADKAFTQFEKTVRRHGVLLNDKAVLNSMEHGLNGRFIPVTVKVEEPKRTKKKETDQNDTPTEIKETLVIKNGELRTLEEFGDLMNEVNGILCKIGDKMVSGEASASPMKNEDEDACKYCRMKVVCRKQD